MWIAKQVGCSGLHLCEHQHVRTSVTADQVDFASRLGTEVPKKDFVARLSQEPHCNLFAAPPKPDVGGGRWLETSAKTENRSEPPGRTFDGGDDMVREPAISRGVPVCRILCSPQIGKPEIPHASRPSYGRELLSQ
jgi:hypothetical protein